MKIRGKVSVVTGAASGIGKALASALAEAGSDLRLVDVREEEVRALADRLGREHGVASTALCVDLTQRSAPAAVGTWLRGDSLPDLLVNNAGGGHFGRFDAALPEEIERTLLLDVHAPTFLTRELLPVLLGRPEAMIVNISSGIARLPYPGLAVYGAAKGYISSLSESLACELADTGVRVLCFHPGFTDTGFMKAAGMDMRRIPRRVLLKPARVARRIVRAIQRDSGWSYSDLATHVGAWLGGALPHSARTRVFENLFWKLPPCDGDE
jgi:short-subunit dehydrogenase